MIKGKIHSFESCGMVDGPGVRFVVFMYGCPFKCLYCHNPDTWFSNEYNYMTPQEVFNEVVKYKKYFGTNGGITVSGGEPMMQLEFVTELFKLCKQNGIHTALDTNGFYGNQKGVNDLLTQTDLVLLDIKHMINEKHVYLTSQTNDNTLKFAQRLSDMKIPTWIRYVLVPYINNDAYSLALLKDFLSKLKTVEKVEIIPYHKIGDYKWKGLGLVNVLENIPEATEIDVLNTKYILGL